MVFLEPSATKLTRVKIDCNKLHKVGAYLIQITGNVLVVLFSLPYKPKLGSWCGLGLFPALDTRSKWDLMWRGRGKDMFYTKKRFGKSGKSFEHHNDHYTVVATMNLDQKAIIQVNINMKNL